jgi:hypothetical protein
VTPLTNRHGLLFLAAPLLLARALHAQPHEAAAPAASVAPLAVPEEEAEPEFEAVAEVEAPRSEPTRRVLDEQQLTTLPGTRGDAVRAVEVLPGVGRTQFGTNPGAPPLRGSASNESAVFFDGAPAPLLYHFGGLTSVFNSHLLESVTLYPGNYSARYGRLAGGVIEARVRDPKTDRAHFMLELSALDSFALAEGPLGRKTALALAARRSNVDLFIDSLITDESTAVIAAPVYYDYQAILTHRFDSAHRLRAMAYGSSDSFELFVGKAGEDPSLHGRIGSTFGFHRLQLALESQLSDKVEQQLMISGVGEPGHGEFGNVAFDYESASVTARAQWSIFAAPWLRFDAGLDAVALFARYRFSGPSPTPAEGVPSQGSLAGETPMHLDSSIRATRPAAFVEATLQPARALSLIPALRADYYSDVRRWSIDPRLSGRLQLSPVTTLKAGVGQYSQPPEYWEVVEAFGNPELGPYRTHQTSLGVEQQLGEHLRVDLDGFYKRWQDRVIGTPGGAPPVYLNAGSGEAYGLELLLALQLTTKTRALAAYTLSRSVRQDGAAEARLFDHDQTHNLSLTGSVDLGAGWQAGARFRYVTGNPYSAVQAAVYDASTDTYRPLYGAVNDARNPAFHQLDLRLEKLWRLGPVELTTFLEVMNVYNAKNQERRRYSFDYARSASVNGLPFFPNLGIRGEL